MRLNECDMKDVLQKAIQRALKGKPRIRPILVYRRGFDAR